MTGSSERTASGVACRRAGHRCAAWGRGVIPELRALGREEKEASGINFTSRL